jgi:hypothetical protein
VLTKVTLHDLAPLDLLGFETSSSAARLVAVLLARGRPFLPRRARVVIGLGALEPALAFAGQKPRRARASVTSGEEQADNRPRPRNSRQDHRRRSHPVLDVAWRKSL